jgi:hypothetical protein
MPSKSKEVALAGGVKARVELLPAIEVRRLGQRPDHRWRGRRAGALQDRIDRAPRRLARAFHGCEIGCGPHVVPGQHQIGNTGRRLGTDGPRPRRVDQQPGGVRGRHAGLVIDVDVEMERVQELVAQHDVAGLVTVEGGLELLPDLVSNLRRRTLLGRLAHVIARRVPVGNVDGENTANSPVTVAIAERPPSVQNCACEIEVSAHGESG